MLKKHTTIEDLAIIVKHGFDEVHERLDSMDGRLDSMDGRLDSMDGRIDKLEQKMEEGFCAVNRRLDLLHDDISDLPAIREELKDHDERLVRVEQKIGSRK
ncbi:MAG: hypothetical protein AAB972_04930 [Patescibacteria group bacterium]